MEPSFYDPTAVKLCLPTHLVWRASTWVLQMVGLSRAGRQHLLLVAALLNNAGPTYPLRIS